MIEQYVYRNNKKTLVKVYENKEEADKAGITVVDWMNCKEGDYILTSNGYYVPVVNRYDMPLRGAKIEKLIAITLPRMTAKLFKYRGSNLLRRKHIIWSRDETKTQEYKFLSGQAKLLIKYVQSGFDLLTAYSMAYTNKSKPKMQQVLSKLMDNERFVKQLFENKHMDKLVAALNEKNINYEWLAKNLKDIIEDPKCHASLRQFAITIVKDALDKSSSVSYESKPSDSLRAKLSMS